MTKEQREAKAFANKAPKLNRADKDAFNALFPAYLFRRTKTGEVWTTCCHKHKVLPHAGKRTQEEATAMFAPHQAEPPDIYAAPPKPHIACPFCGAPVIVKELGRTGHRQNLWKFRRAVIFKWDGKDLWALSYDGTKDYKDLTTLTDMPKMRLLGVARFQPGLVEATSRRWWGRSSWGYVPESSFGPISRQDGPLEKGRWKVKPAFAQCREYGMGYDVIGRSEVGKSPFRYCQMEQFSDGCFDFEFLVAAAIYPRQIEMLMKAGLSNAVKDLVYRGVKNAAAIAWDDPNPVAALGLNAEERKAFMGSRKSLPVLGAYKKMRQRKIKTTIASLEALEDMAPYGWFDRLVSAVCDCGLTPEKVQRYLARETKGKALSFHDAVELWVDYISAAKVLGYDLSNPVYATPKGLRDKHDKATAAAAPILQAKADEKGKKRQATLCKRYTFFSDRWLIRPPEGAGEIVAEGKALCHCVGGYAGRHIRGTTTILFLRDRKKPEKPLCTIEIKGNKIIQIHGAYNDWVSCRGTAVRKDPRELYKEILVPWLEWLEAGSKRDKLGRPKLPKKFKEVNVA